MSSSEHVVSIDVGSSSVRCALYDGAGSLVQRTRTIFVNRFETTREGGATVDADKLCELIFRAMDETLAHAGARHICGVGLSTFWHGVLGVDRRGDPTTPVFTWADRRAAGAAELLRERLDETAIHRSTGCMLHSSYLPAKLLWLSHAYPRQFEETTRWLSLGEYLYLKLFGDAAVGTSIAAGTGLFAQNWRGWDTQLLNELPVHVEQLSPVSDEPMRGLRGEFARRWASLRDVPWFPALGDGACSNVGSGCVGRDRLALMVGTSGAMRMLWRADSVDPPAGLWCYRVDASRFVSGGALSDGGNLVAWLRETLRLPDPEKTEELLATMQPGAHGLTFLPLLAGERGPGWTDRANGTIAGLSLATEPIEILRSAMEAVALRFALIAQRLDGAFPPETKGREIVASGGGLLGSPAWIQIMADALGRSITVSAVAEVSSRGAALLALEALGGPEAEKHEATLGETHKPDPLRQEAYREALENQRDLYDVLRRRA